jgi:hypothetical protein
MTDDEFKANVMRGFESLKEGIEVVRSDLQADIRYLDGRLDAVVARLDEQDNLHERLMQKIDRLSQHVALSAQASEQALDAITLPARRVTRLEHPGGEAPQGKA